MMQTVSAVMEKARDAAEQMSGEEPRCEIAGHFGCAKEAGYISPLEMVQNTVPADPESIDWSKYGKRTSSRATRVTEYMEEMRSGDRL